MNPIYIILLLAIVTLIFATIEIFFNYLSASNNEFWYYKLAYIRMFNSNHYRILYSYYMLKYKYLKRIDIRVGMQYKYADNVVNIDTIIYHNNNYYIYSYYTDKAINIKDVEIIKSAFTRKVTIENILK